MSEKAADACFVNQASMLSVDEAIDRLLVDASPLADKEQISVFDLNNRVLVDDLSSPINVPGFDNSAMDGYALRVEDVATAKKDGLLIAQRIAAGSVGTPLVAKTCARIFTGAPMPEGANAVAIQEVCREEDNRMFVHQEFSVGENIRPRGNDICAGACILKAGSMLGPAQAGLIASVGLVDVPVYRKLRVAMFSSGDEIVAPGQPLKPGQIYNSNRPVMGALLQKQGCEVIDLGTIPDTFDDTCACLLDAASKADLVLSSGGVSVGEEDHIKSALESVGELNLWRIRMKPGKPLAFGKVDGTPFIGLPGNPVSVFVTFLLFVRPFIWKVQGRGEDKPASFSVRAGFSCRANPRREYIRVCLKEDDSNSLVAKNYPKQGSDVLSSAAWATGLVEVPEDTAIEEGESLRYLPFSEWL